MLLVSLSIAYIPIMLRHITLINAWFLIVDLVARTLIIISLCKFEIIEISDLISSLFLSLNK